MTGLVVNSIIGSSVFGLPAIITRLVGGWSPAACLVAAALTGVVMLCYAEVASQFSAAGGAYLYDRAAFGVFVGIAVGWLSLVVRSAAAAAAATLFVNYLAELWPGAGEIWARTAILTFLCGGLAMANYRGVEAGARLSNLFVIGKLVPLTALIVAGSIVLVPHGQVVRSATLTQPHLDSWLEALLLLSVSYGGFDAALMSLAEVRNPRRDVPFALMTGLLGTC